MAQQLTLKHLRDTVGGSAAAFRCRRRFQPAGGEGDKVFPPTFAGKVYAVEQRHVPGRVEPAVCVLLDSVQSQANRMELALQEALDEGKIKIPVLEVDFTEYGPTGDIEDDEKKGRLLDAVGKVSSLRFRIGLQTLSCATARSEASILENQKRERPSTLSVSSTQRRSLRFARPHSCSGCGTRLARRAVSVRSLSAQ
jgi:CRISPR-associated protein Csb1